MAIGDKIHLINKEEVQGAIGNINNPLLDLPLNNSLAMKQGVGSVTFSRSTTATYIDRYGILRTADVDEPRFEKDGLLIEGASTNLITHSQDFADENFHEANECDIVTGIANIDGSNDACKLVPTAVNESHSCGKYSINFNANAKPTLSVIAEADGYNYLIVTHGNFVSWETRGEVGFDLVNGTIAYETTAEGSGTVTGEITDLGNNRYKCELLGGIRTSDDKVSNLYLKVRESLSSFEFVGDGASGVIIHNMQGEYIPFATSYIPTTDSAVTRGGDTVSITKIGNTPSYMKDADISMLFDVSLIGIPSIIGHVIVYTAHQSSGTLLRAYTHPQGIKWQYAIDNEGGGKSQVNQHVYQAQTTYRLAKVVDSGYPKSYNNGALIHTDSKATWDTPDDLSQKNIFIGNANPNFSACFHIKNFKIYDRALTKQEVRLA